MSILHQLNRLYGHPPPDASTLRGLDTSITLWQKSTEAWILSYEWLQCPHHTEAPTSIVHLFACQTLALKASRDWSLLNSDEQGKVIQALIALLPGKPQVLLTPLLLSLALIWLQAEDSLLPRNELTYLEKSVEWWSAVGEAYHKLKSVSVTSLAARTMMNQRFSQNAPLIQTTLLTLLQNPHSNSLEACLTLLQSWSHSDLVVYLDLNEIVKSLQNILQFLLKEEEFSRIALILETVTELMASRQCHLMPILSVIETLLQCVSLDNWLQHSADNEEIVSCLTHLAQCLVQFYDDYFLETLKKSCANNQSPLWSYWDALFTMTLKLTVCTSFVDQPWCEWVLDAVDHVYTAASQPDTWQSTANESDSNVHLLASKCQQFLWQSGHCFTSTSLCYPLSWPSFNRDDRENWHHYRRDILDRLENIYQIHGVTWHLFLCDQFTVLDEKPLETVWPQKEALLYALTSCADSVVQNETILHRLEKVFQSCLRGPLLEQMEWQQGLFTFIGAYANWIPLFPGLFWTLNQMLWECLKGTASNVVFLTSVSSCLNDLSLAMETSNKEREVVPFPELVFSIFTANQLRAWPSTIQCHLTKTVTRYVQSDSTLFASLQQVLYEPFQLFMTTGQSANDIPFVLNALRNVTALFKSCQGQEQIPALFDVWFPLLKTLLESVHCTSYLEIALECFEALIHWIDVEKEKDRVMLCLTLLGSCYAKDPSERGACLNGAASLLVASRSLEWRRSFAVAVWQSVSLEALQTWLTQSPDAVIALFHFYERLMRSFPFQEEPPFEEVLKVAIQACLAPMRPLQKSALRLWLIPLQHQPCRLLVQKYMSSLIEMLLLAITHTIPRTQLQTHGELLLALITHFPQETRWLLEQWAQSDESRQGFVKNIVASRSPRKCNDAIQSYAALSRGVLH